MIWLQCNEKSYRPYFRINPKITNNTLKWSKVS